MEFYKTEKHIESVCSRVGFELEFIVRNIRHLHPFVYNRDATQPVCIAQ